ncbi:MAG: HNH endonuclease, partial [Actinomycetota bacterium]|nr:HNH endonuclease [Actinomycetota bacterium]
MTYLEHRWVMEQHIGRRLETWEQVHHRNHDRFDNRIGNLQVVTQAEHALLHSELPREKPCTECGDMF